MEQRALAVSSVLASVAFLEALVNEVWQDASDTTPDANNQRLNGLTQGTVTRLRELWQSESVERSLGIHDKYRVHSRVLRSHPSKRTRPIPECPTRHPG
jgi:hypothetical protein